MHKSDKIHAHTIMMHSVQALYCNWDCHWDCLRILGHHCISLPVIPRTGVWVNKKSVGTVAVICQRGIAKRLSIDNKDNSPRPTIYYWRIYIEHERFVAYYSYTPLKLAISFDKNNMVNASNYLNMFSLKDTSTLSKLSAKIINNL